MKQIFTIKKKKHLMKKYKFKQYFRCFVVGILVPYAFWFSYQQNIVTIPISTPFRGGVLIRGEVLISMWIPKGAMLIGGPALIRGNTVFPKVSNHDMKFQSSYRIQKNIH